MQQYIAVDMRSTEEFQEKFTELYYAIHNRSTYKKPGARGRKTPILFNSKIGKEVDDIKNKRLLNTPLKKNALNVFFSYSRFDRQYREEFEVHFASLKRSGYIDSWFDDEIDPGSNDTAKVNKIEQADIIICLLSPQYMANDYIWNTTIQKAKEAHKMITPITLRACDYKKYFAEYFDRDQQGFLTQKQFYAGVNEDRIISRDIIWIASEQHASKRDEYYNFIVSMLRRIIER